MPETIRNRKLPDVLIDLGGLKFIIEGRAAARRASLLDDARRRVEEGVADISMGVVYPDGLGEAESVAQLRQHIETATYDAAVFYLDRTGVARQTVNQASLDQLAELINSVLGLRAQNDVVREQVESLQGSIRAVVESALQSNLFFSSEALTARLRQALGIPDGEAE